MASLFLYNEFPQYSFSNPALNNEFTRKAIHARYVLYHQIGIIEFVCVFLIMCFGGSVTSAATSPAAVGFAWTLFVLLAADFAYINLVAKDYLETVWRRYTDKPFGHFQ